MNKNFYTDELLKQRLLELLRETFDHDGTIHLLAVAAQKISAGDNLEETRWKLRVALTYRDGNSINPYWDGTELDIVQKGEDLYLLNEQALADEPPMIEGSPIELALEWVSVLATPLWISKEAKEAALEELEIHKAMEAERPKTTEDPFENYFKEPNEE